MPKYSEVSVITTNCYDYPRSGEEFRPSIRYPEYEVALSLYEIQSMKA